MSHRETRWFHLLPHHPSVCAVPRSLLLQCPPGPASPPSSAHLEPGSVLVRSIPTARAADLVRGTCDPVPLPQDSVVSGEVSTEAGTAFSGPWGPAQPALLNVVSLRTPGTPPRVASALQVLAVCAPSSQPCRPCLRCCSQRSLRPPHPNEAGPPPAQITWRISLEPSDTVFSVACL